VKILVFHSELGTGFTATTAAAALFRKMAAASRIAAMKLHNLQSGRYLPHCRSLYATTAAVHVFAAAYCVAKFAIRWRFSSLPPFVSATILPTSPLTANHSN
jgi:hypothetical protein